MPLYRPSAVLRLQVRIDEGRATQALLRQLEPIASDQTSQIGKPASGVAADAPSELQAMAQTLTTLAKLNELTGDADPALVMELEKALAKKRDLSLLASPPTVPDAIGGRSPDGLSVNIGSLPVMRCSIARSSFRTGDKCSFELNYYDAPFDPRLMRNAAVELTIDVISAAEHDAGIHGLRRADGTRYSTVEDAPGITHATRFLGFVSKWDLEFGDDGPTVHGEAEDLMSVLRTTPLPPDVEIDHDQPIELGIKALLDAFPALRGISVAFGPDAREEPGPEPGKAAARRKKVVKKGKARVRRNAENTNIWDHITDVCVGVGCIPVIDGVTLRIDRARTLFGQNPNAPAMIWGQNLKSLKFTRSMQSQKQPTVEVRSFDPDTKRTLAARYPDPHKEGVQKLADKPAKPKAPKAQTANETKAKALHALEQKAVKKTEPITLAQYEQQTRTGPNADYADEILADPQTRF